jgi:hypothetical protein
VARVVEFLRGAGVLLKFPHSSALEVTKQPLRELRPRQGASPLRIVWSDTLAKSKLSLERRARIEVEVEQELLEMNLQELRKAAGVTQADVDAKTGMAQADMSRTESREDHRLSILRRYVKALGGELEVSAVVNGRRVRLVGV